MRRSPASNVGPLNEDVAPGAKKRVLLIEGYDDSRVVEVGYVRQGAKVWVAFGESADLKQNLMESIGAGATLVESMDDLELIEDAAGAKQVKDGVWIVEGPSQRSDVENKNKRKYPRKIWERLIGDKSSYVQKAISERAMLGHLEHPKDGRTDGNLGALVVTESKLRDDGVVWNKYELLDTPAGKILQEYTKKKVRWGISSRGNGSVDDQGVVDPEDFVLETWDGVMRPSTNGAFVAPVVDDKGKKDKTVQEGEGSPAAPATSGVAGGVMTEAAKVLAALVETIETRDVAKVPEADRPGLVKEAEEALSKISNAVKESEVTAEVAIPLSARLGKFMGILSRAEAGSKPITEAAGSASSNSKLDKRGEAFNRVIGDLQERVRVATAQLATAQTRIVETEEQLGETARERDDLLLDLASCKASLVEAEQQRDVARNTIVALSEAKPPRDDVAVLTEALVSKFPALADAKAFLVECASADEVAVQATEYLIERASPAQPAPVKQAPAKPSNTRAALPRGLVVESEEVGPTKDEPSAPMPPQVTLAGLALKRMTTVVTN